MPIATSTNPPERFLVDRLRELGNSGSVSRSVVAILLATIVSACLPALHLSERQLGVPIVAMIVACGWIGGLVSGFLSPFVFLFVMRTFFRPPDMAFEFNQKEIFDILILSALGGAIGLSSTKRRQALKALREKTLLLEQQAVELSNADSQKNRFLAILAHELRNPLAPLRSGVQLLRLEQQTAGSSVSPELFEVLERQIHHMVRLIDDLLDVSRVGQGKVVLHREVFSIAEAVRDAVDTSRPHIDSGCHGLTVSIPAEEILVDGDRTRLAQVVANLLNNAAKFTPAGGRIEVRVESQKEAAIICVRDSGIGVSPDAATSIFEEFVQADSSIERSHGGLGIGLSLVRSLVEMHGGTVDVQSDGVNLGSEFTVQLPCVARRPAKAAVPRPRAAMQSADPPTTALAVSPLS